MPLAIVIKLECAILVTFYFCIVQDLVICLLLFFNFLSKIKDIQDIIICKIFSLPYTRGKLRTRCVKHFLNVTLFDLNNRLKHIKYPRSVHACTPISELPYQRRLFHAAMNSVLHNLSNNRLKCKFPLLVLMIVTLVIETIRK